MNQKKILVVEDERPLSEAITAKLTKTGYNVVTAASVDEAIKSLKAHDDIGVIWLDHYLLGEQSGLDLVAKMKEHDGAWSNIPIFLVSNTASLDKVNTYIRLGVKKYYVKSDHRLEEIIKDIEDYLEKGDE